MNVPVAVTLWGTLALLLALNLPVAVALGLGALITIASFDLVSLQAVPELMYSATNSWTLLASRSLFLRATSWRQRGSL